jgi:UDP-N-acetylglucosamine 2-epimerase (non-hydrolysing)
VSSMPINDLTPMKKWILVVAARPNFMKIAPLIRAINKHNDDVQIRCQNSNESSHEYCLREINHHDNRIQPFLVHTGQHYDDNMSDTFFRDLELPVPDIHLGIGSGSHAEQTGRVMIEFEQILMREKPHLVIVVGDVNSTMACALAAVKLHIPIAHVEAGLRSFDRTMPEEINRIVTDAIADYLFTPSPDGDTNLLLEGIKGDKIFLVGDIMVDSLLFYLDRAKKTDIQKCLAVESIPYALVTMHRPSNVDSPKTLERIIRGMLNVAERISVIFPMHPRTRKQVDAFGLGDSFVFHPSHAMRYGDYFDHDISMFQPERASISHWTEPNSEQDQTQDRPSLLKKIHAFPPLGYLEFLNLMAHAAVVLTDSGGIQEETTVLNIPCITLRDSTERPITLTDGTNIIVHDDPEKIIAAVDKVLNGKKKRGVCPALWDGHTAERIISILKTK